MRANLVEQEPERIARWEQMHLYEKIQEKNQQGAFFILHDGPPFTNGDVHIGTALNKILKDIILRYKSMRGFRTPYVPGWDCHGLPIEHKVAKQLREEKSSLSVPELRRACAEFSKKFRKKQRQQFQRLGILADWAHEYCTMDPPYEAIVLEIFAKAVEQGYVYRRQKPVYWSIPCKTALAEAEIEYKEHRSPSIWVTFSILEDEHSRALGLSSDAVFVIWTTTPWTLPSNMAIALHPKRRYVEIISHQGKFIVAETLLNSFVEACNISDFQIHRTFLGQECEGIRTQHPLISRESPIVLADYVSADTGTGCVHIAPGHGLEDYQVGLQYHLEIYSPIDDDGCYVDDGHIPQDLVGISVLETEAGCRANEAVIAKLRVSGHLLAHESISHSYPYCWRSKTPVIFRAMHQWFLSIDHQNLRERALEAIDHIQWLPSWGENRIRGAIVARPDWCISRQRSWGIPLPVFFNEHDEPLLDASIIRRIADKIRQYGSDFWFRSTAEEILKGIDLPQNWSRGNLRKGEDTLDVWIDSGSSHTAVLKTQSHLRFPADLYFEGSDQHRGWFQSSLWTSLVANGQSPYRSVLTHGFIVGDDKKKISKSDGKPQTADDYVQRFGADIVRLWIASEDFRNDIPLSDDIFTHIIGSYRTIRNTLRFQLGNLFDFDPVKDAIEWGRRTPIDRWILQKTRHLIQQTSDAYEHYEFHRAYQYISRFCNIELSAQYHDILKDRLYTLGRQCLERRSSQTTIYQIFNILIRLLAPILTFTCDEAYEAQKEKTVESIHLTEWPKLEEIPEDSSVEKELDCILGFRSQLHEKLEKMRQEKIIGQSLDAHVIIHGSSKDTLFQVLHRNANNLPEYFIVSKVTCEECSDKNSPEVEIKIASGERCPRCWRYVDKLIPAGEFGNVSERCGRVLQSQCADLF
ncbi:MAG: isoleucine--tRNA ligase [Puniceicoccales bacterium]|jgi:isoleucyl-tRNA synthetase|nr:isoleucine--tRNA ligase [Puniceicoccales bacterium]